LLEEFQKIQASIYRDLLGRVEAELDDLL